MLTRAKSRKDTQDAQCPAGGVQTRKRMRGPDPCPSRDTGVKDKATEGTARKKQRRLQTVIVISDDDADPDAAAIEMVAYHKETLGNDENGWLPHTRLVLSKSKSCPLPILSQSQEMQQVIADGLRLARRWLVFGGGGCDWVLKAIKGDLMESFMSPMAMHGTDTIFTSAMLSIAKESGHTSRGGILDRLEHGSPSYTKPLISLGSVRLRKFCTGFKAAVRPVVYHYLRLNSLTKREVSTLIEHSNYIYPASGNKFDKTRPFENKVLAQAIRAAFFTPTFQHQAEHMLDLGLVYADDLTSSDKTRPDELEVSSGMLLFAAAAVASVLKDKQSGRGTEFSGTEVDALFKEHLVLLATLRKIKPGAYHRLMHGILTTCRDEMPIMSGRSNVLLKDVEWDSIPEE